MLQSDKWLQSYRKLIFPQDYPHMNSEWAHIYVRELHVEISNFHVKISISKLYPAFQSRRHNAGPLFLLHNLSDMYNNNTWNFKK